MKQTNAKTLRIYCLTLILAFTGSKALGQPALHELSFSIEDPYISSMLKITPQNGRSQAFFGAAFRTNNEERLWIFPNDPQTSVIPAVGTIDTSVEPESVKVKYTIGTEGGSPLLSAFSQQLLTVLSQVDDAPPNKIEEIIPLNFPPDAPYVFVLATNTFICGVTFSSAFRGYLNDNGQISTNQLPPQEKYEVEAAACQPVPIPVEEPKLLLVKSRTGITFLAYGRGDIIDDTLLPPDTGKPIVILDSSAIFSADIGAEGSWQPLTNLRIRRLTSRSLQQEGVELVTDWEVSILIPLYERPGSIFHGENILGASSQGIVSVMSLTAMLTPLIAPTQILDLEKQIDDMVQSSMFYNKIICGHAGDSEHLITILDIGQATVHHAIDKLESTENFIYHRGITHPYGSSVYFFIVFGSAETPESSSVYYLDYPEESMTTDLSITRMELGVEFGYITDMEFFPNHGYIALIGIERGADSGIPTDFYFKAQIFCHKSCATCKGLKENQCLSCPRGHSLNKIGMSDAGRCSETENRVNEVEADCGGVFIDKCVKCESGHIGFCQICRSGSGLDQLSERGSSGEFCVDCPVTYCETCEITSSGKKYFSDFFRENLSEML